MSKAEVDSTQHFYLVIMTVIKAVSGIQIKNQFFICPILTIKVKTTKKTV